MLKNLANQNKAPYRQIKKRAENERSLTTASKHSIEVQTIRTFRKWSFSNIHLRSVLLKVSSNKVS